MSIRSAEQWQDLIARQKTSGLSIKAFCDREGIGYDWFCLKRKRILNEKTGVQSPAELTSFVKAQPILLSSGGIEIRCRDVICRLPSQTPAEYVAEILKAL